VKLPRPSKPAGDGYRRLLSWAALPVTDRRWAAPLAALALGFGLFVGVAIGPSAAGTLATGAAPIIEIPGFAGVADDGGEGDGGSAPIASADSSGGPEPSAASSSSLPAFEPPLEAPEEPSSPPPAESPKPDPAPPKSEEEEPEAETLSGTVVHVNPAAASYALAEAGGTLSAIHTGKPPRAGTEVTVPVRLLANGTYAEAGQRQRSGQRTRATFDGVVSYVGSDPADPMYTVSRRGASVLVHVHPDPAGTLPPLPVLGAFATVAVDIEKAPPPAAASPQPPEEGDPMATMEATPPPSCVPDPTLVPIAPKAILWQRQVEADGTPFAYSDFAGIVTAVCPSEGKLLLSADDERAAGSDLSFAVPAGIDTSGLAVGDSVTATATIGSDGTLALTGLASDERAGGADDIEAAQGDLAAVHTTFSG
jgi:hypothetical protein